MVFYEISDQLIFNLNFCQGFLVIQDFLYRRKETKLTSRGNTLRSTHLTFAQRSPPKIKNLIFTNQNMEWKLDGQCGLFWPGSGTHHKANNLFAQIEKFFAPKRTKPSILPNKIWTQSNPFDPPTISGMWGSQQRAKIPRAGILGKKYLKQMWFDSAINVKYLKRNDRGIFWDLMPRPSMQRIWIVCPITKIGEL